jgi:hypothetical protein
MRSSYMGIRFSEIHFFEKQEKIKTLEELETGMK